MKKWTKVLSAFVVASVMCVGVSAAAGCDGCDNGDEHTHTYKTEWSKNENGHWLDSTCGHNPTDAEPHKDEYTNGTEEKVPDGKCDVCEYDVGLVVIPPEVKVTVTFDSDGGSAVSPQEITKGGKVNKPEDPTKKNHTFAGWFEEGATTEFDFDTAITADITLKAHWTAYGETPPPAGKVTVTFDSDGGSAVPSQEIDEGGKAVKPENPTKANHTFAGWFKEGATTEFDFNTAISESITLTAHWTLKESVYDKLVNQTEKHIVNENFDTVTEVGQFGTYGTAGVYQTNTKNTEAGKDTCNVTVVDGKAVLNDASNDNGTALIVDFGSKVAATGTTEGYFETTITAEGSGWTFIQFGNNGSEKLGLRSVTVDKKNVIQVRKGGSSGTVESGLTNIELVKNTTYKIYFKIVTNVEGSTISLKIAVGDGEMLDFCEYTADKLINSVKIVSSDNKSATQTIDNIIVIGDKMTVDDYRAAAQKTLENAFVKMVGKPAVGNEGEEGYVPEVIGTHTKNALAITTAYGEIDLTALTDMDEIKAKVDEFVALQTSIDSDAKIKTAVDKYAADIAKIKTENSGEYTINKTAFDALIAEYEGVDLAAVTSVKTVTDKYAEFEGKLAEILTDGQEAEKALNAKKAEASATVNAAEVPEGAIQEIADKIAQLKADALAAIANADTITEVEVIITDFNRDYEAAKKRGDLPAYKVSIKENLSAYAKEITDTLDAEEDATLIADINAVKDNGAIAIDNATDTDAVDAQYLEAETAIDRLVAKNALAKYAENKKGEILSTGTYEAITAIKAAIDEAVTAGNTAIDAAVKLDIDGKLDDAKTAIDTEFAKINAVTFTVTINGVENVTATAIYGKKVVIDESSLAKDIMVKGWYTDESKQNAYNFDLLVYDDLTLYATTVEAIEKDDNQKFVWSKMENDGAEWADQTPFEKGAILPGVTFLTVGEINSVIYRASGSKDDNKNYIVINKDGFINVEYKGTGTLKVALRGTGKTAETKFYLQGDSGNCKATGATKEYDGNVYGVTSSGHVEVTFTVTKPGVYKLGVLADSASTARISVIDKVDNYKVEKVPATGISISNGSYATVAADGTLQLDAVVTPTNSTSSIIWKSSNEEVATVDKNGLVTAKAMGLVIITATIDGHVAEIMLDVASFAAYVQEISGRITNYDGSGVASSNAQKFENAKTNALEKLVKDGQPAVTMKAEVDKVFADFEALVATYANATFTVSVKDSDEALLGTHDINENATLDEAKLNSEYAKKVAGQKLVGWFTDKECLTPFDFTTQITADCDIYAKYESVTVTFKNGEAETNATITSEGKVEEIETPVDAEGRNFLGWFVGDATEAFDFDTVVYTDLVLTAKWQPKEKAKQSFMYSDIATTGKTSYAANEVIKDGDLFSISSATDLSVVNSKSGAEYSYTDTTDESKNFKCTAVSVFVNSTDLAKKSEAGKEADFLSITAKDKNIQVTVYLEGLKNNAGVLDTTCRVLNITGHGATFKTGGTKNVIESITFTIQAGETVILHAENTTTNGDAKVAVFGIAAIEI